MNFQNRWRGKPKEFFLNDAVFSIEAKVFKYNVINEQDGMVIPLAKIIYKTNGVGNIEFEMTIVSEKLDEIAKDENVESGVEDSEPEEK